MLAFGSLTRSTSQLYEAGDELLVLVNNLGGMSNFEMSLLARSLVARLEGDAGGRVTQLLVGSFMTSFDMRGASVSVLPLTGAARDALPLLDAATDAPAWAAVDVWKGGAARPSSAEIDEVPSAADGGDGTSASLPPVLIGDFAKTARAVLAKCSEALMEAEPLLTKYDTIVGDGDCGITMERGAKEILKRLEAGQLRLEHPATLFSDLADAVSASMGGTSGILLELMFRKASTRLTTSPGAGIAAADLAAAFEAGAEAVSFYGGAREGSRTMLDALRPASRAMAAGGAGGADVGAAAEAARVGADATAAMGSAEAGRSNYLSENVLTGTPDPGAVAVAVVLEAMAAVF